MTNKKICFFIILVSIFSIFSFIYIFSLQNIIYLWTYSEVHLNYSQGFIRRGLFGEILIFFNNLGIKSNFSFSTIFYIFYLINALLFFKILKNITENLWYQVYFIFNPAFIPRVCEKDCKPDNKTNPRIDNLIFVLIVMIV